MESGCGSGAADPPSRAILGRDTALPLGLVACSFDGAPNFAGNVAILTEEAASDMESLPCSGRSTDHATVVTPERGDSRDNRWSPK